ncbi:MAG: Zn-finger containing protein [Clostridia bacterium]|jgi:hypothetical protein|nr:Zn-finger containing protein [Clostridia bacterium]
MCYINIEKLIYRSFLDYLIYFGGDILDFNRYFKDSYGWDNFSKFLLIIGAGLLLVKKAAIPAILIIGYALWRSISKDQYKRKQEAVMFEEWLKRTVSYLHRMEQTIKGTIGRFIEGRKYVIVSCPKCSAKLRLPRHKGQLIVICRLCHAEFRMKT